MLWCLLSAVCCLLSAVCFGFAMCCSLCSALLCSAVWVWYPSLKNALFSLLAIHLIFAAQHFAPFLLGLGWNSLMADFASKSLCSLIWMIFLYIIYLRKQRGRDLVGIKGEFQRLLIVSECLPRASAHTFSLLGTTIHTPLREYVLLCFLFCIYCWCYSYNTYMFFIQFLFNFIWYCKMNEREIH